MSCISSNFSSFFLNSLNDPSEFSKYLSNGELKCTNFEEFQVFAQSTQQQQQQQLQQQQQQQHPQQQQHQQQQYLYTNGVGTAELSYEAAASLSQREAAETPTAALPNNRWPTAVATPNGNASAQHFDGSFEFIKYLRHSTDFTPNTSSGSGSGSAASSDACDSAAAAAAAAAATPAVVDKCNKLTAGGVAGRVTPTPPLAASPVGVSGCGVGLLDLDSASVTQKSRSASRKVAALLSSVSRSSNSLDAASSATLDAVFDHDSKQTIFELQHLTSTSNGSHGSNSNESSLELLAFPSSHLNASNSNTSSEEHCGSAAEFGGLLGGASCSAAAGAAGAGGAPKLLGSFVIKENFEVHPSHKVEEGIFQHMNKLPSKKKDTLKQLGVRFTGQMTLTDKSIVVDNFIRFCEEYDIKDHRPWLSLNQCGLNKPEQIKFARYLGQGLPTFTLFCIYSNFKNLFCTKRTEIYTKDGYNLPYILDKTKRFLANTTAGENTNNNNNNNNNNSNKPNTTTTTTSTQLKQTQEQSESSPASPAAAAATTTTSAAVSTPHNNNNNINSHTHATGNSSTHLHTQQAAQSQQQQQQSLAAAARTMPPTGTPLPRPGTPTTPAALAATPTTPLPQHTHMMQPHHMQQQQQQQSSTPTRGPPLTPQQHSHAHHHQQQQHPHAQHPHPHPHHYPHPHPHQQQHSHSHPHAHPHHFAYAHPHHTHYGLPPHPHQHTQHPHTQPLPHPHPHAHMAAMGYGQQVAPTTAPPNTAQQQQQQQPPPPPNM